MREQWCSKWGAGSYSRDSEMQEGKIINNKVCFLLIDFYWDWIQSGLTKLNLTERICALALQWKRQLFEPRWLMENAWWLDFYCQIVIVRYTHLPRVFMCTLSLKYTSFVVPYSHISPSLNLHLPKNCMTWKHRVPQCIKCTVLSALLLFLPLSPTCSFLICLTFPQRSLQ